MIEAVADYYGRALAAHGPTARGVDWASPAEQALRFDVLLDVVEWTPRPTLLDYGCGYGALVSYLDARGMACDYAGFDIAPEMLEAARRVHPDRRFVAQPEPADYVIASGIFNVKLDAAVADWEAHVDATIARLGALARRGLAFNMLPPASPPERARADLHYAEPTAIAARCRELGAVTLRRDYGLWEFSVLVRR
ncbi:MAG TPA: methyltransferase domain-containing protein [Solirubrobacteraceae bacterium]